MDDSFVQLGYETGSSTTSESSESEHEIPTAPKASGIKLVLPSLKALQAAAKLPPPTVLPDPEPRPLPVRKSKSNSKKPKGKRKQKYYTGYPDEEKNKAPRPLKLKPLKEVLTRLIAQIKRKDDYGFFLRPVDVSNVPGYADLIKRPMDFGTMSVKVDRGKYRSLDEFTEDFRLVISNCKAFNAPDSIYCTEAERIEAWGMEHITKAAATVIQYETSWDIDVEKDDDDSNINVDDDEDYNPALEAVPSREASVISTMPGRRTTRAAVQQRKPDPAAPGAAQGESIDAEGRLPGSKDGLGAFPAGSDWAKMVLGLKLKGKKYKTKKERLRVEKEGPPYFADGSLAYTQMQDPFTILSALVPDPPTRPFLTPIYPPYFLAPSVPPSSQPTRNDRTASQTPQPQSQPTPSFPSPVALSTEIRPLPSFPDITPAQASKRKHWIVSKSIPARVSNKGKDRDDDSHDPFEIVDTWKTPREAHPTDFGSFAILAARLAEEIAVRKKGDVISKSAHIPTAASEEPDYAAAEQGFVFDMIREGVESASSSSSSSSKSTEAPEEDAYWNNRNATEAEDYLRDVVYGGVDGYAYVRSLAEFVSSDGEGSPKTVNGSSLSQWVEQHIVDPLTEGRHSLIRQAAYELARQSGPNRHDKELKVISSQVKTSLEMYPQLARSLMDLQKISAQKIDMAALIKAPDELFVSEEVWVGRKNKEEAKKDGDGDIEMIPIKDEQKKAQPVEGHDLFNRVLDYTAGIIAKLDEQIRSVEDSKMKVEDDDQSVVQSAEEDKTIRDLRLNLLALAKRAPLDALARLPVDLVPQHIRHHIPPIHYIESHRIAK